MTARDDRDARSTPAPRSAESASPLTVLVVDDHEMVAQSIVHLLAAEPDFVPVGIACRLAAAVELVVSLSPDIVLLDDTLPGVVGTDGVTALLAASPQSQILLLTSATSPRSLTRALGAGVAGFAFKTGGIAPLVAALRACARGEGADSVTLLPRLLSGLRGAARTPGHDLTDREFEIVALLAQGLSNATIAQRLQVSIHTVRNHIANVSAKLGAHSKLEILAIAVRHDLVPADDRL